MRMSPHTGPTPPQHKEDAVIEPHQSPQSSIARLEPIESLPSRIGRLRRRVTTRTGEWR